MGASRAVNTLKNHTTLDIRSFIISSRGSGFKFLLIGCHARHGGDWNAAVGLRCANFMGEDNGLGMALYDGVREHQTINTSPTFSSFDSMSPAVRMKDGPSPSRISDL